MSGLTPIHWKNFERFLKFVGCEFAREKGDHRIWKRSDLKRPIVIPKDIAIPVFIIRNNLRLLNLTPQEYINISRSL